jgi:2-keto-4-pentenoate hydratase
MSNHSIFQNPKSGSIKVEGTFQVVDAEGKVIKTVTDPKLCGCGLSQDKPFCDKSHASYVEIVTRMLEDARVAARAIRPVGVWELRAFEIRKKSLENRITAGEKLVGVKFGGALIKEDSEEKRYEGIFGYLTDAMQVSGELQLDKLIAPIAEAEVVFKLGKDLDRAISLTEVMDYVSQIAPGIEVFDCRYGAIDPFIDDAIADNACAGAFAIGNWIEAKSIDLQAAEISIFVDDQLNQKVSTTAIAGNPWQAVVNASEKLSNAGVVLPAGSIIFSGSATSGIAMQAGKYRVEITGVGEVSFVAK